MEVGNKSERLRLPWQLRTDEAMAREIRALAALEHRSVQDEIRHLIHLGLEAKRRIAGKETFADSRHQMSFADEKAKEASAQNVAHGRALSHELKRPPASVRVSPAPQRRAGAA